MNFSQCANCLLHGWKQVEDETKLQRCKRCKHIKYCGRECQTEHWLKVHHKHCKYFADPVKAQQWDHKKENCVICRQTAVVGISQIMRPDNPNYGCMFEAINMVFSDELHPHPFPVTGDPTDTYEKAVLVLLHLLEKFRLTQSRVFSNCREEFTKVISELMGNRVKIWMSRKILPKPQLQSFNFIPIDLSPISGKLQRSQLIPDPFQLWKIIELVDKMRPYVRSSVKISQVINPLASVPAEFHPAVHQGASNSDKFLATANKVLDALATRVIPYQDVFSIIRGDSVDNKCTFCPKEITISDVASGGPYAHFSSIHTPIFCCGNYGCIQKTNSAIEDNVRSMAAALAPAIERESNPCDFCFKLPPSADVHRCSKCLSVMYCSTDCQEQDWDIHKKVCKEDVEERKKKGGGSVRRKEARGALEDMEKSLEQVNFPPGVQEVAGKFRLMKSKKPKK